MKHKLSREERKQIQAALEAATTTQLASAFGRRKKPKCGHLEAQPETCKLCLKRVRIRAWRERKEKEKKK